MIYGIAAYAVWGLSPLFWNLVEGVATATLLGHRIVWAIPALAIAITVAGTWPSARTVLTSPARTARAATAGALLFANWAVFLWAVTNDRVVDASLGYFITPLVSVALGVLVLGERLRRTQWLAVAVAVIGVAWLTLRYGSLPWVSLVLAGSFGVYGLLKKWDGGTPALVSLFSEIVVVAPPAIVLLVAFGDPGSVSFGDTIGVSAFFIGAGAVTAIPLVLFGAAARRIPLSMVGLLQYLAPTLQFMIGVAVYGEELGTDRLVGFVFVWTALAIYTTDEIRLRRSVAAATTA